MKRHTLTCLLAATLTLSAGMAAAETDDDAEFSQANQLLFLENHLEGANGPMVYEYQLTKRATKAGEDDLSEGIRMTSKPDAEAQARNVSFDYDSGDDNDYVRKVPSARGNPVIMMFLQRDVSEMDRLTGGSWRYFQKQVKLALEHESEVESVTVDYNGEQVSAQQIRLVPYRNAERPQMAPYRHKVYEFIVSESIPGEVYEIRTRVPAEEGDQPLIEESLRLTGVRPAGDG